MSQELIGSVKKKLRSGAGEFIGFTVGVVMLMYFLSFFLGLVILQNAMNDMNYAAIQASRSTVVCSDMSEATQKAQGIAEGILSRNASISNPRVTIRYTAGSDEDWTRGSYIDVIVSGRVDTISPLVPENMFASETVMIEYYEDK